MTRWAPLAGIAFVIVFVATGVAVQDVPPAGSTDAEIRSYFTDHDNQLKVDLSTLAFTLSALLLIWGVAGITARLRTTRDGDLLRGVALVSGGAAAAVLVVGAALGAVVADTSNDTGRFVLDPNTTRLLTDVSYTLMFEVAFPLLAPFSIAVALAALRNALLPRWLAWAGFVAALGCLLGLIGGSAVFLLWLVAVCFALLRAGERGTADVAPIAEGVG